jgi:hypothetical protein
MARPWSAQHLGAFVSLAWPRGAAPAPDDLDDVKASVGTAADALGGIVTARPGGWRCARPRQRLERAVIEHVVLHEHEVPGSMNRSQSQSGAASAGAADLPAPVVRAPSTHGPTGPACQKLRRRGAHGASEGPRRPEPGAIASSSGARVAAAAVAQTCPGRSRTGEGELPACSTANFRMNPDPAARLPEERQVSGRPTSPMPTVRSTVPSSGACGGPPTEW